MSRHVHCLFATGAILALTGLPAAAVETASQVVVATAQPALAAPATQAIADKPAVAAAKAEAVREQPMPRVEPRIIRAKPVSDRRRLDYRVAAQGPIGSAGPSWPSGRPWIILGVGY